MRMYHGSDVAIKKLKCQTMTKDQLANFANEARVMIGLRNPSILFKHLILFLFL